MSDVAIERATLADASAAGGGFVDVFLVASSESSDAERVPRSMPAAIPSDQRYYWSVVWQDDIRESLAALRAGDYEDFESDDPNDVVRWLLEGDPDED